MPSSRNSRHKPDVASMLRSTLASLAAAAAFLAIGCREPLSPLQQLRPTRSATDTSTVTDPGSSTVFTSPHRITSAGGLQYLAAISGDNVVYLSEPAPYQYHWLNLATGSDRQITTGRGQSAQASISGDRIAYSSYRTGFNDIYVYDLSTGIERQLTNDEPEQFDASISGDKVVWADGRDFWPAEGIHEIYM